MTAITLSSKSPWHPAMRREHAFTCTALGHGIGMTFIEPPERREDHGPLRSAESYTGCRDGSEPAETPTCTSSKGRLWSPGTGRGRRSSSTSPCCGGYWRTGPKMRGRPFATSRGSGAHRGRRRRVFDCADDGTGSSGPNEDRDCPGSSNRSATKRMLSSSPHLTSCTASVIERSTSFPTGPIPRASAEWRANGRGRTLWHTSARSPNGSERGSRCPPHERQGGVSPRPVRAMPIARLGRPAGR